MLCVPNKVQGGAAPRTINKRTIVPLPLPVPSTEDCLHNCPDGITDAASLGSPPVLGRGEAGPRPARESPRGELGELALILACVGSGPGRAGSPRCQQPIRQQAPDKHPGAPLSRATGKAPGLISKPHPEPTVQPSDSASLTPHSGTQAVSWEVGPAVAGVGQGGASSERARPLGFRPGWGRFMGQEGGRSPRLWAKK